MRLFFGLALLAFASGAFAWSADGHKLICQLAYDKLSDEARTFVIRTLALGEELDGNGSDDFAEACLWPDSARYEGYKWTYEQHFINVPRSADAINLARDCAALDCIAVGLQRSLTYLDRRAESSREQGRKAAALRFLGHYMGDLYQPLHAGHGEDWGGNKIGVSWFGEDTNLHRVWDSGIMTRANITWPDSLEMLAAVPTDDPPEQILSALKSSFRLARSHAYPNVSGGPIRSGDSLGDGYFERAKPIVIEQITMSAAHLASVIEGLADGSLNTNVLIE